MINPKTERIKVWKCDEKKPPLEFDSRHHKPNVEKHRKRFSFKYGPVEAEKYRGTISYGEEVKLLVPLIEPIGKRQSRR